jgi:hypothetical protein
MKARQEKLPMSAREQADLGPRGLKDTGSEAFAWQTIAWLKQRFHSKTVTDNSWQKALEEAEQYRIYDKVPPEAPYGSLDALLQTELGMDAAATLTVIRKRMVHAAKVTTGEVLPEGGDQKSEHAKSLANLASDSQAKRAAKSGISPATQKKLDRLARDFPELREEVKEGRMSVDAAARKAGFVKKKTVLEQFQALWAKASPQEQCEMRAWINNPVDVQPTMNLN